MDFEGLASRLGIDEEDFMELVELFVSTSLSDIEKIKNGMAQNDCPAAAAASHSIKGAAANMGFDAISSLSKDMEMQAKGGSIDNFETYVSDLERMVTALASA